MRDSFKQATHSRMMMLIWSIIVAQMILLIVIISINIHPSQLQLPFRFSEFSSTQYFREQWFYILNFLFFAIVFLVVNFVVAIKILEIKGRHLTLAFQWLNVAILAIITAQILAIVRVAGIQ